MRSLKKFTRKNFVVVALYFVISLASSTKAVVAAENGKRSKNLHVESLSQDRFSSKRSRRYLPPTPSTPPDEMLEAYVGHSLIMKLDRQFFIKDMMPKGKLAESGVQYDPVEFFPSLDGKPSLPRWLQMAHRSFYEDAFLYGTPPRSLLVSASSSNSTSEFTTGSRIRLCVIAIHKEIYTSVAKFISVRLLAAPAMDYQVQIVLLNYQLVDFLRESFPTVSSSLRRILAANWENDVSMISVSSSSPSSVTAASSHQSGVIVRFGSSFPLHERLKSYSVKAEALRRQNRCGNEDDVDAGFETTKKLPEDQIRVDFEISPPIFYPKYVVDWCRFRIREGAVAEEDLRQSHSASSSADVSSSHRSRSLPLGGSPPHRFDDFVLYVILPMMALAIVVVLLARFMFGHRHGGGEGGDGKISGPDSRAYRATTSQLRRYSSVRQASETLRLLSVSAARKDEADQTATPAVVGETETRRSVATIPRDAAALRQSSNRQTRSNERVDPTPTVAVPGGILGRVSGASTCAASRVVRSRSFSDRLVSEGQEPDAPGDSASPGRQVVASVSFANPLYSRPFLPPDRNLIGTTTSRDLTPGLERGNSLRAGRQYSFNSFTRDTYRSGVGDYGHSSGGGPFLS